MRNATASAWVTAPRYMHVESMLRKYALEAGFEIETHVDKGLFRETIFFKARGTEDQLEQFKHDWNKFMEED